MKILFLIILSFISVLTYGQKAINPGSIEGAEAGEKLIGELYAIDEELVQNNTKVFSAEVSMNIFPQKLTKNNSYTKKQVYKYTGLSLLANLATITGTGSLDSTAMSNMDIPWWLYTAMGSHHLPLYALDAKKALRYTAPDAAFLAMHLASKKQPTLSFVPLHFYINDQFFSTYEIYKITRQKTKKGIYPEDWKTYDRKDLMIAPFKKENLIKPIVYVPIAVATIVSIVVAAKNKDAIWNTGTSYIDGEKIPIAAGVTKTMVTNSLKFDATAAGEEALYRGVVYEELKLIMGPIKAKIADAILFPAIHIPGDIAKNASVDDMINNFIFRSFSTLLFDFAYDKGGLPASTALHFWFNNLGSTINWFGKGGVPPLTIGFSTTF